MGCLGVIALVLALPTFGLSIVAYFAIAAARGYIRGKVAACAAAERRLEWLLSEGKTIRPSWADDFRMHQQLVDYTLSAAMAQGMTSAEAKRWFLRDDISDVVMTAAACFEREGFGHGRQLAFACDFAGQCARKAIEQAVLEAQGG